MIGHYEGKTTLDSSVIRANRPIILKYSLKINGRKGYVITDKFYIFLNEFPHVVPGQDWTFLSLNQYTNQEISIDPGSLIIVDFSVDPEIIVPVDPYVDPGIRAK